VKTEWAVEPLGDLCDILDSMRKPVTKKDRVPGEIPYYGATGIQDYVAAHLFDEPLVLVGEDGAKWGAGENTAFAVSGKCWVNNHAHVLRPDRKKIIDNWLIYYLNATDLNEYVSGLTVPKLNQGSLRQITIPVPPLPEQRRIVAILDEAFEGIAAAKGNAERILRNTREITDSATQALLAGVSADAVDTTIGAEVDLLAGFAFKSVGYTAAEDGVRLLRGDNIIPGALRWDDAKRWPKADADQYRRYALAEGDTVLAMDRPWVSAGLKLARITGDDLPCLLVQRVARLRAKHRLDSRFLYHHLGTQRFIADLLEGQTGSGVPHISGKQITDHAFARPSLAEQKRVAGTIDVFLVDAERLESIVATKLAAFDELKASLLHQAFTGNL
jgi:type I restriction enzyme S subunit